MLARYGFAVLATATAFGLTRMLVPHMEQSLFLFFYTAVAATAWHAGLGPGLLATALSVGVVNFVFVGDGGRFAPASPRDALALGVFGGLSIIMSSVSSSVRAAKRRSDQASAEAKALAGQLELQTVELERQVSESRLLANQLEATNRRLVASTAEAETARRDAELAEARSSSTLASIADGFIALDAQWRFQYINRAASELFRTLGRDASLLLGMEVCSAFPELRGTQFETATSRAALERSVAEFEACYDPLDRWLHVRVYPADEGVTVYFRDVTEQKRAEATLRRQANVLNQTHDAILVWETGMPGEAGEITQWNRGAEALYGFSSDEALGRISHALLRTSIATPVPGLATVAELDSARARDGHWEGELVHVRKDGRPIVVESRQVLVADTDASPYVVETNRDVTERTRAEAALRESEERFRTLADTVPMMIWLSDQSNLGTYFNAPWLEFTGCSLLEQHMAAGWAALAHANDRERVVRECEAYLGARRPFSLEFRMRRVDGEYRWVLNTGVPRYQADGTFTGFAGSCVDITERKRTEDSQHVQLEAARMFAGSLDLDATISAFTALLVPNFADYVLVYLRDPGGALRQVGAAHVDPDKTTLLERLGRFERSDFSPESGMARVLSTARPVLQSTVSSDAVPRASRDPELIEIYHQLSPISYMIVPLMARGQLVGVATLATSTSGRRYGLSDLALVELLAARAALALDNARLYTETLASRDRIIESAQLETQLMQARLDVLRAQLNPHFLFNALNVVTMLVRRGATDDALSAIVALSELLRQLLDERGTAEVKLGQELAVVEHYLALERLRFRERLAAEITVDPEVRDARVPVMLMQPLVENAVKHGVARRASLVRVSISSRRERTVGDGDGKDSGVRDTLVIEIKDDGPGFAEGWDLERATGVGLANTRERLRHIFGDRHQFEARNAPEGGAVVTIRIPFRVEALPTPLAAPSI